MTIHNIRKEIKRIASFYGGTPPADVVASAIGVPIDEAKELIAETMKVPDKKKSAKKHIIAKIGGVLIFIKILSAIISGLALLRSSGYTFGYFIRFDNEFFSYVITAFIVLVTYSAPQIMVLAWKQRKWLMCGLASILMLIFTTINILVTVDGLAYNRETTEVAVASNIEQVTRARERLIELKAKEIEVKADKVREGANRDMLQEQIKPLLNDIKSKEYITVKGQLNLATTRYDACGKVLDEIDKERKEIAKIPGIDSVAVKQESTKERENVLDVVLAVSMDIAPPIYLAFVLFL